MYKQILSVLLFVLVLGACQLPPTPTPTSTPTSTSTPTPTPLPPGVISVPLSAVPPSPAPASPTPASPTPDILDLIIVLDSSKSMKDCTNWLYDENQQDLMSQKIVQFFYTLFDPVKVKVHVTYLLPKGTEDITFIQPDENGLIQLKPINATDNHYLSTFKAIYNDKSEQFGENYLVLMISDGAFNSPMYTGDREETRAWLDRKENEDFLNRLYVIQPERVIQPEKYPGADKDKDMWKSMLQSNHQYVLATERKSVGEFLRKMINNTGLKDALPVGGQFWNEETKSILGNTFEVSWKVWGIWDVTEPQPKMRIGGVSVSPQINPHLPGDEKNIESRLVGPKSAISCPEHSLDISDITENPDVILAYYVIETVPIHQYLVLASVQLSTGTQQEFSNTDEDIVIWNPTSLSTKEIQEDLVAEGGRSLVNNYQECYSFSLEFTFKSANAAEQKCLINDNSIVWSDVFSEKNHEHVCDNAFNFDSPGEFHAIFQLKDDRGKVQQEWRNTSNISIRFYPEMKQISIEQISEDLFRYEIPFKYAKCQFYTGGDKSCLRRMHLYQVHEDIEEGDTMLKVYGIPDAVPVTFINDKKPGQSHPDNSIYFEVDDAIESIYLFVSNSKDSKEYPAVKFLVYWDENTPAYFCTLQQPGQALSCNLAGEGKDGK